MDFGLLLLRLVVGLTLVGHGSQKLFGAFEGPGIHGTGRFLGQLGFGNAALFAVAAGLGEFVGGLFITLGLLTPFAAGLVMATMLVAIATVHIEKGFFNEAGGFEYPLLIIGVVLSLSFIGPGRLSFDSAAGMDWSPRTSGLLSVALGVVGAAVALGLRSMARGEREAPR